MNWRVDSCGWGSPRGGFACGRWGTALALGGAFAGVAAACSPTQTPRSAPDDAHAATADATADADAQPARDAQPAPDGAEEGACPAAAPADGAPCATATTCSWGTSPAPTCRSRGVCVSGRWSIAAAPAYCSQPPASCPASIPAGACTGGAVQCAYPDGTTCACQACCDSVGCTFSCNGAPQGSSLWSCTPPPALRPPCPSALPNDGTACALPAGTACVTSTCGLNVTCDGRFWRWRLDTSTCPSGGGGVCAAPSTPIATPDGERPIAELRVGDRVYSVDHGAIRSVVVGKVARTFVEGHRVLHVRFAGGRSLDISPGHPTADGRRFADVQSGAVLDGHPVVSVDVVPYADSATYDILPLSETETYFAAGVRVGSTLSGARCRPGTDGP